MSIASSQNLATVEGTVIEDLLVILLKGPRTARSLVIMLRLQATKKRPAGSIPALYRILDELIERGLASRLGLPTPEPRYSLSPVGRLLAGHCLRLRQLLSAITTTPEQVAAVRHAMCALNPTPSISESIR